MLISQLHTPQCLIDKDKFLANIKAMDQHLQHVGIAFRPHVKTLKSLQAAQFYAPNNCPITVSTLKEAAVFSSAGYQDILYAVGITPNKFQLLEPLIQQAEKFTVLLDSLPATHALVEYSNKLLSPLCVMIEVDVDDHRAGLSPNSQELIECGKLLARAPNLRFRGIVAHAGASYGCESPSARQAMAQQECDNATIAFEALKGVGVSCELVSVGSTPTALIHGVDYKSVNEIRAGVYTTFDCVMAELDVCRFDDIAMSVLTTVIGNQFEKGWVIVDAGWMALSRDKGADKHCGYGLVCDVHGTLLEGWYVKSTNQEHGIICHTDGLKADDRFKYGTQLRILPIHACSTGSQFDAYKVVNENNEVVDNWSRVNGW